MNLPASGPSTRMCCWPAVLVAAIFAFFVVTLKSDHIITGTAISMLGVGTTGTLYRILYGTTGAALDTPTLAPLPIPLLHEIPIIGAALFAQPMVTYLLYVMVPVLGWWLTRTGAGLALRAVGERPEAAVAAGISPVRVRWAALLFCGAMGGLSGGTLVLAQVGTFNEGISAGRGFIAIAIVVLGRWSALGVTGAALLFGAASALQYLAQAMGWGLPYQFSLALPYVLTLIALAWIVLGSWVALFPGTLEPLFGIDYPFEEIWGLSRMRFEVFTLGTMAVVILLGIVGYLGGAKLRATIGPDPEAPAHALD